MIALLVFLIFSGSMFLYNTSKIAILNSDFRIEKWAQKNIMPSKWVGVLIMIISLLITLQIFGSVAGIFIWLILVMIILGLVILMSPLKIFNYLHVIGFLLLLLTLELSFI
ncbi:hypothetical protein [Aquimarina sediminis]|uniref:hypothetical protein n=1 Tax=Aquimarina sediminis TaxID=2070536 RepID=UPI000CA04FB7|nr:hypothetical protein [Aquimarina sediminis]